MPTGRPAGKTAKEGLERTPAARVIADSEDFLEFCRGLSREAWFAFDTEFVKEKTYFAQLGIVQVAAPNRLAIIDVPAVGDLGPFLDLVEEPAIEKVVHSAAQDLEALLVARPGTPRNLYDTQIAAALVGYGDQISYAKLVARVAGVRLAKRETRSDWMRRPLSPQQIAYALDDVRYLPDIKAHLEQRLVALHRRSWLREELEALERRQHLSQGDPGEAYRRIRVGGLNPQQRGVLRELAAWREREARQRNLPRGWVIPDATLVELARRMPKNEEALRRLRALERAEVERSGAALLDRVKRGRDQPLHEPAPTPADEHPLVEPLSRLLEAWMRAKAEETEVSSSLLGTREDLKAMASGHLKRSIPEIPLLAGWRKELVGRDLLDLLSGRIRLSVDPESGRITGIRD